MDIFFYHSFCSFCLLGTSKVPFAPSLLKTIHSSTEAFLSPVLLSLNKGNRKKAFKPYFQNHNTFFRIPKSARFGRKEEELNFNPPHTFLLSLYYLDISYRQRDIERQRHITQKKKSKTKTVFLCHSVSRL
jgi:hypothetical protein